MPPPGTPTGPPRIVLNQAMGDGDTTFVVSGRGWARFARITLRLAGVAARPATVVTDNMGSFNYVINQEHEFFAGPIPPGRYTVVVSAPGGPTISRDIDVNNLAPPDPGARR